MVNLLPALETNELYDLGPESYRGLVEAGLVRLDDGALPDKVGLARPDDLGPVDELPGEEEDGREDDHGVVDEEVLDAPRHEARVAVAEDDNGHAAQADPAAVGLEVARVGERAAVDALRLAGVEEEEVRGAHDDVVDDAAGRDQVHEPRQDLAGAAGDGQEREEGEEHHDAEAVNRNAVLGALAQDLGRTAFQCQTVQVAGCAVRVSVAGGKDTRQHESIGQMGQAIDAKVLHSNDIYW